MGNTESVVTQQRLSRFRPEERPLVEGLFDQILPPTTHSSTGKGGRLLTLDVLKRRLGELASERMIMRVFTAMVTMETESGAGGGAKAEGGASRAEAGVSRDQLVVFLADVLRGTAEERAPIVMAMSGGGARGTGIATVEQIIEFLQDLLSAVVKILTIRGRLRGWHADRMGDCSLGVKLLAEQMCSELKPSENHSCDVACLEDWIFRVSQVSVFLELLVSEGLGVLLPSRPPPNLLPPCTETPWGQLPPAPATFLLGLPLLLFLAPQLPDGGVSAPWRMLFSTRLHGESFSRMVGGCQRWKGPSVLIVRDTKGHIFGGFASKPWEMKPQFQGDSRCFLFSVSPCLRIYNCTGYNQNYMYLNQGQKTMPNGLGMGGQHDYFGLWLDSDFGRGHSRARPRCTTYGSPQLSGEEDFTVDALEVWGVGHPPVDPDLEEEDGKRSILDKDKEVQALMEMTGKTLHSQGLREPEEDEN